MNEAVKEAAKALLAAQLDFINAVLADKGITDAEPATPPAKKKKAAVKQRA